MATIQPIAEIAFGVLYLVGAIFNAAYTLRHGREFYGGFLEGAWHEPARRFLRAVILPHATAFTTLLILFQLAVATALLTRGDLVGTALVAGAVFCVAAAGVSSPGGTLANLAMAAVQLLLASLR